MARLPIVLSMCTCDADNEHGQTLGIMTLVRGRCILRQVPVTRLRVSLAWCPEYAHTAARTCRCVCVTQGSSDGDAGWTQLAVVPGEECVLLNARLRCGLVVVFEMLRDGAVW